MPNDKIDKFMDFLTILDKINNLFMEDKHKHKVVKALIKERANDQIWEFTKPGNTKRAIDEFKTMHCEISSRVMTVEQAVFYEKYMNHIRNEFKEVWCNPEKKYPGLKKYSKLFKEFDGECYSFYRSAGEIALKNDDYDYH